MTLVMAGGASGSQSNATLIITDGAPAIGGTNFASERLTFVFRPANGTLADLSAVDTEWTLSFTQKVSGTGTGSIGTRQLLFALA